MNRVVVFGSINVDLVMGVADLPRPGETVVSSHLQWAGGGKGANQAHAAARVGTRPVAMVGCVGHDDHGRQMISDLAEHGVDTAFIARVDQATGIAAVAVDSSSENFVIVHPGANAHWPLDHVEQVAFDADDVLVAQLEIPPDIVDAALRRATDAGATTLLNAAPLREGTETLLDLVDLLVVNELEMTDLFGAGPDSEDAITRALAAIRGDLVVTLGANGVLIAERSGARVRIAAHRVVPIDTVGAGDAFVGALGAALAEGASLVEAAQLANATGAVTATVRGARHPTLDRTDLDRLVAGAA